jgi:hypothetical protein
MTYRVASDLAGTVLAGTPTKEFTPHLVCSWTLDPASHRLSCVWATPVVRWEVASPARVATRHLSPGMAQPRVS